MTHSSYLFVAFSVLVILVRGQVLGTCDQFNICLNGFCQLQPNQQSGCTCHPGFILDPINPLQCLPVPPCNLLQGSPHEQCLNGACTQHISGDFACVCYTGYRQSNANPNICENIDECKIPAYGCALGSCTDLIGDYSCTACIIGHTLDQSGKCQRLNTGFNAGVNTGLNGRPNVNQQQQQYSQGHDSALPWMFPMIDSMMF